jgi:hypothetical protein
VSGAERVDVTELARRLDALESADAVRHLKADYMSRCDASPRPSFTDLLWPDAVWQGYEAAEAGPLAGAETINAMLAGRSRFTFSMHCLTNESISVDGDVATGLWNLLEPCTVDSVGGIWQGGRYVDTFARRDGQWRFARMELHLRFRTRYEDGWHRTLVQPL